MGKLVKIEKIFPFTKKEINQIKTGFSPSIDELWFPYSDIDPMDLNCFYEKDNPEENKMVYVSYIGNPAHWDWMIEDRLILDSYDYGFCDNATQARLYAEEQMKDDDRHGNCGCKYNKRTLEKIMRIHEQEMKEWLEQTRKDDELRRIKETMKSGIIKIAGI